jgi:hypothetical protein
VKEAMQTTPSLLWIGDVNQPEEFRLTFDAINPLLESFQTATIAVALARLQTPAPTLICLAEPRPGMFTNADVLALSGQWPLARIVVIAGCLADGRRRSGPDLPGVIMVPWHDLPARLRAWLHALAEGRPSSLDLPLTARRDERWLNQFVGPKPVREAADHPQVTVAADSTLAAEAVGELVLSSGGTLVGQQTGRPSITAPADLVIWDVGDAIEPHLGWLRLLARQRPHRSIVLLCSFPRSDAVRAAIDAGATAVLGRPTDREALSGILLASKTALSATSLVR